MKTMLYGALALGCFTSLATAGNEAKSTWLGLDEELHALSSNVTTQNGGGPTFGATIKTVYTHSEDDVFGADSGNNEDISGFELYNARLWAEGAAGNFGWRLSFDFGDEVEREAAVDTNGDPVRTSELLDAYVTWDPTDNFRLTWGHFCFPTLFSNAESPENLLFINRSVLGQAFYDWDLGAMVSGDYDQLRWNLAIQNGSDGTADEYRISGRVEFDFGNGRQAAGSRDARSQEFDATVGVFGLTDDNGTDDNTAFGADMRFTVGNFGIGAEIVSVDDNAAGPAIGGLLDQSPWSIYGSFAFTEEWEAAVRYEDVDDADDTTLLTVGVNFHQYNSPAVWQFNFLKSDSDNAALDGDALQLGLVLGLNG